MNASIAQLANLRPYQPGHAPTNKGKGGTGRPRNPLYDGLWTAVAVAGAEVKLVFTTVAEAIEWKRKCHCSLSRRGLRPKVRGCKVVVEARSERQD